MPDYSRPSNKNAWLTKSSIINLIYKAIYLGLKLVAYSIKKKKKKKWVSVNSIDKISDSWIRDLDKLKLSLKKYKKILN